MPCGAKDTTSCGLFQRNNGSCVTWQMSHSHHICLPTLTCICVSCFVLQKNIAQFLCFVTSEFFWLVHGWWKHVVIHSLFLWCLKYLLEYYRKPGCKHNCCCLLWRQQVSLCFLFQLGFSLITMSVVRPHLRLESVTSLKCVALCDPHSPACCLIAYRERCWQLCEKSQTRI